MRRGGVILPRCIKVGEPTAESLWLGIRVERQASATAAPRLPLFSSCVGAFAGFSRISSFLARAVSVTDSQALSSSPNPVDEVRAGDGLRRTREAQGLSISEVAHALKLNPRQIEALESGRFDLLPGFAFTRGFLRNYARLLKIDPAPLLAQLEPPEADANVELAPSSNAQGEMPEIGRGRFRRSVIPGILAALALLGVVVAGWYYDTLRSKPAEELAASLPAPVEAVPSSETSPAGETVTPVAVGAAVASPAEVAVAPQVLPGAPAVAPEVVPVAVPVPAVVETPKAADGMERLVFDFSRMHGLRSRTRAARSFFRASARPAPGSNSKHVLPFHWLSAMPVT
jgi:cytoskeleton protein RodZ